MNKHGRKISLRSYWFAFLDSIDQWLWNFNAQKNIIVLMFHNVTDESIPVERSCLHTVGEFDNVLTRLHGEGYAYASISQIITPLNRINKSITNKYVAITFDDVPYNFWTNAYPVLKEKKIPFTLFIADCFIGKEGFLSKEQIMELAKDPLCTIGAHTTSHSMLRKSKQSYFEMINNKTNLEKLIGKRVDFLAYPYGKHSSVSMRIMQQAKKAGFKRAFGTIDAPMTVLTRLFKFFLPRMVLHS